MDPPPDEEIIAGNNQRFRVLHVVPFDEEDELPFVGLLQVEAALTVLQPGVQGVTMHWHAPGAGVSPTAAFVAGLPSPFSGTRSPWL